MSVIDPFCTNGSSPPLSDLEYAFVAQYLEEGDTAFTALPHHLRRPWKTAICQARFLSIVYTDVQPLEVMLRRLLSERPATPPPAAPIGRKTGVTGEHRDEIRARYAEGESLGKLAEAYRCSRTTIARIVEGVRRAA